MENKNQKRRGPHSWSSFSKHKKSSSTISWPYCKNCGLVLLKNDATLKRSQEPCEYETDE